MHFFFGISWDEENDSLRKKWKDNVKYAVMKLTVAIELSQLINFVKFSVVLDGSPMASYSVSNEVGLKLRIMLGYYKTNKLKNYNFLRKQCWILHIVMPSIDTQMWSLKKLVVYRYNNSIFGNMGKGGFDFNNLCSMA